MQHKLACNSLSSVGVSNTGELLTWGSNKYYILGQKRINSSATMPANLKISENDITVTDISLGEFHAACIINDKFTNSTLNPLMYAREIFLEIKERMKELKITLEDPTKPDEVSFEQDILNFAKDLMQHQLEIQDVECEATYSINEPYVSKKCFCLYLQNRLKILYKNYRMMGKLLGDTEVPNRDNFVNIREVRDQILEYRYSNGTVWTWGLDTNGRLGRDTKESYTNYEPSKVTFPSLRGRRPILIKVSCGSSNTLALTNTGEVFSWGLGQRGCLGLGNLPETSIPEMIKITNDEEPFMNIKDIVCGSSHCLALGNNDIVYSWGCGISGRLGHGSEEHYNLPKAITTIPSGVQFIQLAAGDSHSAAISKTLEVYTWGDGAYGKLGHGTFNNEFTPKHVKELMLLKVIGISCGMYHTLVVTQSKKVYSFGGGAEGKLGLDILLDNDVLIPNKILSLEESRIVEVAAGPYHSLALSDDGKVYAWGSNREGRLGVRSTKEVYMLPEIIPENTFHCVAKKSQIEEDSKRKEVYKEYDDLMKRVHVQNYLQDSEGIVLVSCGEDYTAFLSNMGRLYVCGNAEAGRLGREPANDDEEESGDDDKKITETLQDELAEGDKATEGSKGQKKTSEKVSGNEQSKPQGDNEEGELSIYAQRKEQYLPCPLDYQGLKFTYVSCGRFHTMAVTVDGAVYCWGKNTEGQLGLLGGGDVLVPTKLTILEGIFCKMVACGENHSLILSVAGDIYSCGRDENGKLGHTLMMPGEKLTDLKCEFQPRKTPNIERVHYIACGPEHSMALVKHDNQISNSVYAWGRGWFGQLGTGRLDNQYMPTKIEFPSNKSLSFVTVTCGDKHTLLLDADGNIWFTGQLLAIGLDAADNDKQLEFTMISSLSKQVPTEAMLYIATGQNHNLCLSGTGKIYAFGRNDYSKCGARLEEESVFFKEVKMNDINMSLVSCGRKHSVACDLKGIPYTWGNLTLGRLGINPMNFDQKEKEVLCIDVPREIMNFKTLFAENVIKIPIVEAGGEKEVEETAKYIIQRKLLIESSDTKEETLSKKYILITERLREAVRTFVNSTKLLKSQMLRQHMQLSNAIISRIYTFPSKIPLWENFLPKFPRNPLYNRQTYETIFSLLQIHPCYILQLINEGFFKTMNEFVQFIKAVFNPISLAGNKRTIHLLTCLANDLIKMDIPYIDILEMHKAIKQTYFYPVFRIIFKSQQCNRNCILSYVEFIIQEVAKENRCIMNEDKSKTNQDISSSYYDDMEHKSNGSKSEDLSAEEKDERTKYEEEMLSYKYNLETNPNKVKEKALITIIKKINGFMDSNLQSGKQQTNRLENKTFSQEVLWLLERVRKIIEKRKTGKEPEEVKLINDSVSSLIVYLLWEELGTLLSRKLKDVGNFLRNIEVDNRLRLILGIAKKTNEGFNSYVIQPKGNLVMISECFTKYTKHELYTYAGTEEVNKFINQATPFLNSVASKIQTKEYDSTMVMLKDFVKATANPKPVHMSISLADILFVHEVLYRVAERYKEAGKYNELIEDRLYSCFDAINFKMSSIEEYPAEERKYSLNFTLPQQILVETSDIVKCDKCKAIVTSELVPQSVIESAYEFPAWKCPECEVIHSDSELRCSKCKRCRDRDTLAPSSMLKRYRPLHPEPILAFLEEILVTAIPLITTEGDDFDQLIQVKLKEYEKENNVKMMILINKYLRLAYDEAEEAEEEIPLENRLKLVEENFNSREEYFKYISFIENVIKYIKRYQTKVMNNARNRQTKVDDITRRVMSGLGNDFLYEIQQSNVLSGNLKKLDKPVSKTFESFMKKTQEMANDDKQKNLEAISIPLRIMKSYSTYGTFQIKDLQKNKILVNFKMSGRQLMPVERKCYYHFFDNGDYGFNVVVVFHDTLIRFWKCSHYTIECQIERFEITKEILYEMRRNKCLKNHIFFKSGEFDVFHMVNFLEAIRSRIYCYLQP